jgi:hypothetical protein
VSNDFTSRTARVPTRFHKRRLTISDHAIERFRERVDEEFRHRNDNDLGNLLDERLSYAEFNYQVHDPRAPEAITTIRSVACRHATYFAVVRDETVITVLDEEMAHNNFDPWTPVLITTQGPKLLAAPRLPALPSPPQPQALPAAEPSADKPAEIAEAVEAPLTDDELLAEAGIAYARARKQQRACEGVVAAIKADLDRATEALLEAELAVDDTHRRLMDLAGKGDLQR